MAEFRRVARGVLMFAGWRILAAGVVGLLVLALWFVISPLLAVLSPFLVIIFFPELAGTSTRWRRQRGMMILTYLEQAVRLNLPLPRMLEAAQQSEEGQTKVRLQRLREALEGGASIEEGLRTQVPEVGPRVTALVGAAERSGRLAPALARVIEDGRETPEEAERASFGRWYPLLMLLVITGVVLILMVFVVPKLEQIYRDFGIRLPAVTASLIGASRAVLMGGDDVPILLFLIPFVALWILGGMFERIWTIPAEIPKPRWLDQVTWRIPVVHGIARDRGLADVCDTIAGALRGGWALPQAIEEATTLRINDVLRGRVRRWGTMVRAGRAADEAARAARLPDLFCGMIGAGRGGGNGLVQAVEFLTAYYGGRFSRSREVLRGAATPAAALFFGGIVLWVAGGMFTPIVQLIDHLNVNAMEMRK